MTADEISRRFPNASKAFIGANLSVGDTGAASVLEPNPGNAPLAKKEVQGPDCQGVFVRVTSIRKRLIDPDNLCEKYHVDLCRYAGIITGDTATEITLETTQQKCGKGEAEQIVIEVYGTPP